MREASAKTLLSNISCNILALVINDLVIALADLMDGSDEPDPMLCQDLNDLLKAATDIYDQRIQESE